MTSGKQQKRKYRIPGFKFNRKVNSFFIPNRAECSPASLRMESTN